MTHPDRPPSSRPWLRWLQTRSTPQKVLLLGSIAAAIVLCLHLLGHTLHQRTQTALLHTLQTTTQVTVQLGDLHLQPLRGRATLTDLLLSNPPHFSPQPLLTLDRLTLHLHLPSLWQATLSLPEIRLQGLTLRVEQRLQRNNLAQLLDRLETLKNRDPAPSSRPKAFQIDHLILSEVTMVVRLNILGEIGAEKTLHFAAIDLADLNQDTLADRLRSALLAQAQQQLQELAPSWGPPPASPTPAPIL